MTVLNPNRHLSHGDLLELAGIAVLDVAAFLVEVVDAVQEVEALLCVFPHTVILVLQHNNTHHSTTAT